MKTFKRITLITIFVLICVLLLLPQSKVSAVTVPSTYVHKTREYRACWVSVYTGDIPSYQNEAQYKQAFNTILDNMESWGMNAIVYHIRIHNDALYNSDTCPIRSAWSKVDFDVFDPLEWSIEAAHARGIEFHAWLNPYRVKSSGVSSTEELQTIASRFPSSNPASDINNLLYTSDGVILDPGLPNVRQFITDTCMDVVTKYDVDAINFDDYFYISGCDDSATRAKYNTTNLSLGDFRRKQVDLLIEQIHNALAVYNEANDKAVQLGIAPSSVYRNGSYGDSMTPTYDANGTMTSPLYSNTSGFAHYDNYLYCDTKKWVDNEWIDYITPQTYHAISHSASSFAKLDKWWNWVVEYKKVNLYMGVGLYMQVEADTATSGSYYYWKDPKEMENQILDINKYANIGGLCIYKYGSILSSKELIASARDALTSYWDKKVPCPILPQHTNLPEPMVTGITLSDNILSWDSCSNVRGYVVWQVPTGHSVDVENYDQLYRYTTSTSVTIVPGYDYYISSVNLANEFSLPESAITEADWEKVIASINQITLPVTLDEETKISSALAKYNSLTPENQTLVSNYYLLQEALAQLNILKGLKASATTLEASLKKDVLDQYLLPLSIDGTTVSWEHVDASNEALYDINTGKVQVEYLATTLIPLRYTLTKDGFSYSGVHNLNIGYVKQGEIGLFYRNTPNAMNKAEDANAGVSFIGWSGVVLKFTLEGQPYVFFQAIYNYHELTSSEIPSNNWSSCGDLYVNTTNVTISAQASSFDVSTSTNYGYFIIGADGYVRLSKATATSSETISLAPGEALYCVKYLDSQINGSVMRPASNLSVGTKVELVKPVWQDEDSPAAKASVIIDQINLIPSEVTLDDQDLIERCEGLYNSADSSVQALVTNYQKLVNARSALNDLLAAEAAVQALRNNAKSIIANYILDLSIYSDSGKNQIANIISVFNTQVETKSTEAEINALVATYKGHLDNVLTQEEEDAIRIQEVRDEAIEEINNYITDLSIYSVNGQNQISSLLEEYEGKINNETLINNVNALVTECEQKLDAVPTYIEEIRASGAQEVEKFYATIDLSLYSATNQTKIRSSVATAKNNISSALSQDAINAIINNLKSLVASIKTAAQEETELRDARSSAIEIINNYPNRDNYNDANLEVIDEIIARYTALINVENNTNTIISLKADALRELADVEVDPLAKTRKEIYNNAVEYGNSKSLNDEGKNYLTSYLTQLEKRLKRASSEEAMNELYEKYCSDVDILASNYPEKEDKPNRTMNCLSGGYVVMMLSLVGVALILIKKHE